MDPRLHVCGEDGMLARSYVGSPGPTNVSTFG
jgi:hypothetical protein